MRFVTALAAMAALLIALPAAAQKAPEDKPVNLIPRERVMADHPEVAPLPTAPDPENTWLLDLSDGGRVTIRLRPDVAPKMVERVELLTRQHFYDGLTFHRVNDAPEGMAQGGDPKGDGTGGSTLPDLPNEFSSLPHVRGAVSAARTEKPDSANSQFFIMFGPHLGFDENYTVFGRVVSGMEYVDGIHRGEPPADPTKILHAYIAADNPPPYQAAAPAALPAGEERVTLGSAPPKQ